MHRWKDKLQKSLKLIYRINAKPIKTLKGFFVEYNTKWLSNAKSNRQDTKKREKEKSEGLILSDISCPDS